MTINQLITQSNSFTDESVTSVIALEFVNMAVAIINNECDLTLPLFENVTEDYISLSDSWQKALIGSYLSYGVKMNDASLNEAQEYKLEFEKQLQSFKNSPNGAALVSDDLKSLDFGGVYGIDTTDAVDMGLFGNSQRGGM